MTIDRVSSASAYANAITGLTTGQSVIAELQRVGCDTAKSVLELSKEELIKRTDLEILLREQTYRESPE